MRELIYFWLELEVAVIVKKFKTVRELNMFIYGAA